VDIYLSRNAMNLIRIQILVFATSIMNFQLAYTLGSGNNPMLSVSATVTTSDDTITELNGIRINKGIKFFAYTKPTKIDNPDSAEIRLAIDPVKDQVGPIELATTKKITIKNPKTIYIYQEKATSPKHCFIEAEIDGISRLVRNNFTLTGKDANNVSRTIELSIIKTIEITGACAKIDTEVEQSASTCVPAK
jgi:hypothetical protein